MPRGEDVEIAESENFLPFLVALFLVASLAPTFLLFFTRLPSSFENLAAANRQQNTSYPLSTLPWIHPGAVNLDLADHPRVSWNYPDIGLEVDIDPASCIGRGTYLQNPLTLGELQLRLWCPLQIRHQPVMLVSGFDHVAKLGHACRGASPAERPTARSTAAETR
jgi:hypothetical protein